MIGRLLLALLVTALPSAVIALPLTPASTGEQIFQKKCSLCHGVMGPGTLTLGRRQPPATAMLANRTDLDKAYIGAVVRHGLNSMPAITRVEVTDVQLERIEQYLTRNNPPARKAKR